MVIKTKSAKQKEIKRYKYWRRIEIVNEFMISFSSFDI